MGFDPGVFGRFDLAALVQPHLKIFVCLFVCIRSVAASTYSAHLCQLLAINLKHRNLTVVAPFPPPRFA